MHVWLNCSFLDWMRHSMHIEINIVCMRNFVWLYVNFIPFRRSIQSEEKEEEEETCGRKYKKTYIHMFSTWEVYLYFLHAGKFTFGLSILTFPVPQYIYIVCFARGWLTILYTVYMKIKVPGLESIAIKTWPSLARSLYTL